VPFRSPSFHGPAQGPAEAGDIHDPELEALKAGDEAAFQSLIQRYHGPMLRLAMTYVGDRGVAEDVVQESWLTCVRSLDRFEGRSSLKTWIFGIVINIALSLAERRLLFWHDSVRSTS